MKLNENKDHIATLLRDTIVSFCKNFVSFKFVLNIEGFIVLTCDEENVLVVKIEDSHKGNCGISNSGASHDTSFGPGTTSKLFALNNTNKPVKARQPLSLQYSNWNTAIGQPQVLKQPKTTKQKAPQPLKKVASFPRGMAVGQRMGAVRPRTNGQRPAVQAGAKRMGGVRQRMPIFPRNVVPSSNFSQNMALLPMTNFGQRMPSTNMPRQSLPVQSRQLAVQYVPRRMDVSDASEPNLAICDVASNEVVETTSPIRYLDESREKMFRDVVSDALSKLDGNKSTEQSPLRKVSESTPITSECIVALVPVSQTISAASYAIAQKFEAQNRFPVNPGKQTGQSFPCLSLNNNVNQPVHNMAHCPEKARSTSHLQISLITKSHSNLSTQSSSMQPGIRPNPNSLTVPSHQWPRLISGSVGYLTKQSDPAVIWPKQMVRTTASVQGSLSSVPQPGYGLIGQANSGIVQWSSSSSQLIPRLQHASYLSNDLKNQLHNVFDRQAQPVQQIQNVYPQQIQSRYASPLKNNSVGIQGSSLPFQSLTSQSHQSKMHFQTQVANPYFTGRENHAGMVYYQPNANLYQLSNHQDISARGLTSQERNFCNQTLTEKISKAQSNYPGNTLVQYSIQVPVLQNSLSQLPQNFSNVQRSSAGEQFMATNLHIERPMKTTPQQQVIQFKAAAPSAINVIRSHDIQVVPRSLTAVSGAMIPPSPIDSLSSLSSSSSQKPKSSSEYLIPQEPYLRCTSMIKPIQQTISQILQSPTNVNPIALQLAFGVTASTEASSLCSAELMRSVNQPTDGKVVEKRLPPLRLKNLGHGNLMVIESNRNDSCENGTLHIPGKEDDLEAIAMSQVMMAVEGLKEYSSRKNSNENPSLASCRVSIEHEINRQSDTTATLMSGCDINNQNSKTSVSGNKIVVGSLSPNPNDESTSKIIRDVHLSSVDEFFTQNSLNDDLISRNFSLDHEPILETFGVFDVCRNEVVVTRNGNIHESSSNERLSDVSDQTMDNPIDILKIRQRRHKNVESDSSDTTELPDLNSRVESCCDVNFDSNSQGQYTCQACQINMDSSTMLAEHYSTFHTNPEIHWREHEVRPYLDRIEHSSDSQSTILSCPFEGCSRNFTGSRHVISHYSKAHKLKMSYKQIMMLKNKEGSLVRCNYCRLKFPTKRHLHEHVSRMH